MKPNLIGISGKLSSGKDMVGKMIQYFTSFGYKESGDSYSFERFIIDSPQKIMHQNAASDFRVVKFADKLKDIVCLLTGCTRENLEDQEFKDKYIPFSVKYKTGVEDCTIVEEVEEPWGTYRDALQFIGTNLFREHFTDTVWVDATFVDYKWDGKSMTEGWIPIYNDPDNAGLHKEAEPIMPRWLITDVRFPNEVKAIRDRGGILIRVERLTKLRYPLLWTDFQNQIEYSEWEDYLAAKGKFDNVYMNPKQGLINGKIGIILFKIIIL